MAPKISDLINQFLTSTGKGKNLSLAVILAVSILGFGSLIFWNTRTEYQTLFSNLTQEDAGEIISKLKEKKVSFKLENNGGAILVPKDQVYDLRISLASEGLPKGGGVGFEVFDRTNLGTTDFVQKLNYQRALQGELARTIRQIKEIEQARVHVATPRESLFLDEQKKPTASVLIKTRSGMTLSPGQVEGIVHLVASAIEGLEPSNITIVDTTGKVLFKRSEGGAVGQLSAAQVEYQRNIEENLKKKVQTMLEEVLGPNKAIARVSVDMDFQQVEITEEKYDSAGVLRSEQKSTEKSSTTHVQQQTPDTKAEGSLELKGNREKEGAKPENIKMQVRGSPPLNISTAERQNEIRNYEISKVNRHIRAPMGRITKVSAAVIVDGTYKGTGKNRQYVPRTDQEMKNLEEIVKKAVGYDEERKDQVQVVNMPFYWSSLEDETREEKDEGWKYYFQIGYKPFVSLVLALLFIFFIVRPMLKRKALSSEKEAAQLLGAISQPENVAEIGQDKKSSAPLSPREQTIQIAREDPARAAMVIKTWLQEKEQKP